MRSYKGSIAGAVIASSRVAQFLTVHFLVAPSLTLPRRAGEGMLLRGEMGTGCDDCVRKSHLAADRGLRTADRAQRSS
jgi:hypothetical protein